MPYKGLTPAQWLHILFVLERATHHNLGVRPSEAHTLTEAWWQALANRIASITQQKGIAS